MGLKEKFTEVGSAAKEHSTTILTVLTCVGVVATIVSAFKAAPEIEEIDSQKNVDIDDILEDDLPKEERDEKIAEVNKKARKDKFFAMLPTFIFGSLTIGSAIVTEKINHKKIEGLKLDLKDMAVAAALYDKKGEQFKEKARELLGQGKVTKIEDEVRRDDLKDATILTNSIDIFDTGNGNTIFYDEDSAKLFRSSSSAVEESRLKFNQEVQMSGALTTDQREWYYYLGFPYAPGLAANKLFDGGHLMEYEITVGKMLINDVSTEVHIIEVKGNLKQYDAYM